MTTRMNARSLALLVLFTSFGCKLIMGTWEEYRVIDIHGHIGSFKGFDLSTETLLANVNEYRLHYVLVSNIDGAELPETDNVDELTANNRTVEFLRRHPEHFRGLLWSRPNDGSPAALEKFLADSSLRGLFVGIKIHPEMNHFPADAPTVDGYLALCEKYRLPALFHSDLPGSNGDPRKIYDVARRHPLVPVVLYHSGFKSNHDSAFAVVKEAIARNDANLYLETAQVGVNDMMRGIREVGVDRMLFGTDATYFGKEHYKRYEAHIKRLRDELSSGDFDKVVHGNAERLFPLTR